MPVIPLADLPDAYKIAAYINAMNQVRKNMIEQGIVRNPGDIAIRELVVGDEANATDFVDLNVKTAQTAGMEFWAEDSADLTAGDLSSILTSGEKVPDNKVIVIYGFFDLTPNPDLTAIRLKRGSDVLDFWEVEHCYVKEPYGGMCFEINTAGQLVPYTVTYVQNDPIDIQMNFKTSADKYVGLYALIGERYGEQISKTKS